MSAYKLRTDNCTVLQSSRNHHIHHLDKVHRSFFSSYLWPSRRHRLFCLYCDSAVAAMKSLISVLRQSASPVFPVQPVWLSNQQNLSLPRCRPAVATVIVSPFSVIERSPLSSFPSLFSFSGRRCHRFPYLLSSSGRRYHRFPLQCHWKVATVIFPSSFLSSGSRHQQSPLSSVFRPQWNPTVVFAIWK